MTKAAKSDAAEKGDTLPIRTVFHIPDLEHNSDESAYETHGAIAGSLLALKLDFTVTEQRGYQVATRHGGDVHFRPGDWMLFCATGVYPVTPVPAAQLQAGDGMLGFRSEHPADIWDAVMVLKYKPQICGTSIRLVPDPDRTGPDGLQFGIVYADPPQRTAWKYTPATPNGESAHGHH